MNRDEGNNADRIRNNLFNQAPDEDTGADELFKLKLFEEICSNVSKEDERLSLWTLLTEKEKLDMLAH